MAFVDPFGAHRNAGIPVEGCVWRDESVVGDDLAGVIFNNCRFEQVRFERVNLSQTMFLNSCLQGCLFQDCEWVQTRCIDCTGSEVSIQGGELFRGFAFRRPVVQSAYRSVRVPGRSC